MAQDGALLEQNRQLKLQVERLQQLLATAQTGSLERTPTAALAAALPGGSCCSHLSHSLDHLLQAARAGLTGVSRLSSLCTPSTTAAGAASPNGQKYLPLGKQRESPGVLKHKTPVPSWVPTAERPGVRDPITAPESPIRKKQATQLEDDEYVLDDQWTSSVTVINPRSKWKETWDIGTLAFILYSAIVVPFRICFSAEAEGYMWFVEVFISLFFITDVVFNFNTAYAVEDKWVISRRLIVGRYLQGSAGAHSRTHTCMITSLSRRAPSRARARPYSRVCSLALRDDGLSHFCLPVRLALELMQYAMAMRACAMLAV